MKYPYEGDTNLGYSVMGAENVDPNCSKDLKESSTTTMIEWAIIRGPLYLALKAWQELL